MERAARLAVNLAAGAPARDRPRAASKQMLRVTRYAFTKRYWQKQEARVAVEKAALLSAPSTRVPLLKMISLSW